MQYISKLRRHASRWKGCHGSYKYSLLHAMTLLYVVRFIILPNYPGDLGANLQNKKTWKRARRISTNPPLFSIVFVCTPTRRRRVTLHCIIVRNTRECTHKRNLKITITITSEAHQYGVKAMNQTMLSSDVFIDTVLPWSVERNMKETKVKYHLTNLIWQKKVLNVEDLLFLKNNPLTCKWWFYQWPLITSPW